MYCKPNSYKGKILLLMPCSNKSWFLFEKGSSLRQKFALKPLTTVHVWRKHNKTLKIKVCNDELSFCSNIIQQENLKGSDGFRKTTTSTENYIFPCNPSPVCVYCSLCSEKSRCKPDRQRWRRQSSKCLMRTVHPFSDCETASASGVPVPYWPLFARATESCISQLGR